MDEKQETRKKVAVVGSGMAGLVMAYLLQQDPKRQHEVEIFEKVWSWSRHGSRW